MEKKTHYWKEYAKESSNMREWERLNERFKRIHESGILEVTEHGVAFSISQREQWLSPRF